MRDGLLSVLRTRNELDRIGVPVETIVECGPPWLGRPRAPRLFSSTYRFTSDVSDLMAFYVRAVLNDLRAATAALPDLEDWNMRPATLTGHSAWCTATPIFFDRLLTVAIQALDGIITPEVRRRGRE